MDKELETLQDVDKFKARMALNQPPSKTEIPYILAFVFPGDDEVHEVIWENYDPAQPGGALNALTLGGFATPRATELRIDVFFAKPEDFLSR